MLWREGRIGGWYEATWHPGLPNEADMPCRVWFHMTQQAWDRLDDLKASTHHKWAVFLPSVTVAPFPLDQTWGLCHYWASQFIGLIQQKPNLRGGRREPKSKFFVRAASWTTHREAMIASAKKRKGRQKPWPRACRTAFWTGKLLDQFSFPLKIRLVIPTWKKLQKCFVLVTF